MVPSLMQRAGTMLVSALLYCTGYSPLYLYPWLSLQVILARVVEVNSLEKNRELIRAEIFLHL